METHVLNATEYRNVSCGHTYPPGRERGALSAPRSIRGYWIFTTMGTLWVSSWQVAFTRTFTEPD